jgi:hypothetical protein
MPGLRIGRPSARIAGTMALVTRGSEVLLARATAFRRRCSALASSSSRAKRSRTATAASARGSRRRSGRLEYFSSQSRAFPHSLMIAMAEYAGGELAPTTASRRSALVRVRCGAEAAAQRVDRAG